MKRFIALPALLLFPLLSLAGCESETSLSTTPVDLDEASDVALIPEMPEADEGVRDRRRMDIPQLDAAMQVASGGIGWTEIRDGGEVVNLFERLAPTLGVPDYIERMSLATTSPIKPTPRPRPSERSGSGSGSGGGANRIRIRG